MYCTSCVMLLSLVKLPRIVQVYRIFVSYFRNAVRFVVLPSLLPIGGGGGGGRANADTQQKIGHIMG